MDPDTFRGDVGVEGADVYWRRRVSVLTGMLVVVAVVAWACTSASGKPDSAGGVAATPAASDPMVVSLPSGLLPTPSSPGTTRAASQPVAPGAAGQPVPHSGPPSVSAATPAAPATAGTAATPSPRPSRTRRPGDPCDLRDLVIALQSGQDVYGRQATPTFLLTVVSTGHLECTVDVGPRTLEMRVTSGGERIWSTADCVAGEGVDRQTLRRGVPYVRMIKWDRRRSGSDCAGRRPPAAPGTYVASAHAGRLKSPKVVFHLR